MPQNIVEDERSDREETDTEDDEEEQEDRKNGPVQNGHSPLNNNHHRKTE